VARLYAASAGAPQIGLVAAVLIFAAPMLASAFGVGATVV